MKKPLNNKVGNILRKIDSLVDKKVKERLKQPLFFTTPKDYKPKR